MTDTESTTHHSPPSIPPACILPPPPPQPSDTAPAQHPLINTYMYVFIRSPSNAQRVRVSPTEFRKPISSHMQYLVFPSAVLNPPPFIRVAKNRPWAAHSSGGPEGDSPHCIPARAADGARPIGAHQCGYLVGQHHRACSGAYSLQPGIYMSVLYKHRGVPLATEYKTRLDNERLWIRARHGSRFLWDNTITP